MTHVPAGPRTCPRLSVIILVWPPAQRRTENVFTLLASLPAGLDPPDLEVIVVCNGKDARLASRLRVHERVHELVEPGMNLGVASGWNRGAACASGEVLCFVNEDVVLGPATLARTAALFADGQVSLAGNEGCLWDVRSCAPRPTRRAKDAAGGEAVYVPSGYYLAITREVWKAVGGFDDQLSPAFYEEFDMSMRVIRAGYSTGAIGDQDIRHAHGISKAHKRTKIDWMERSVTVRAVNRRNHKYVLAKWSPDPWRSHPLLFPFVRLWSISRWRAHWVASAIEQRLPWQWS